MENVLAKIVAQKKIEIAEAKQLQPFEALEQQLDSASPVQNFAQALAGAEGIGLIAEVKKASPSAGLIREDFDPVGIAKIYEQHGACCISVLTDEHFFRGKLEYLKAIRQAVLLPILRKDFILDRYQILEARVAGADCVLLIAECLDETLLGELFSYASELGMQSLIEIYDSGNLNRVLNLEPQILGVNNRNLKTFVTDLDHSISLKSRIPDEVLFVSESGITSRDDVVRLQEAGIRAILVGETLMRSPNIGRKVDELLGNANPFEDDS